MLPLSIIWQIVSASISTTIWPIIKKIPWQVWVGVVLVIGVLWYGHYKENKGYSRCELETKIAADKEVSRQKKIAQDAISEAIQRADKANQKLQITEKELNDVLIEASKLKQAKQVCLPTSITGKLRRVRK